MSNLDAAVPCRQTMNSAAPPGWSPTDPNPNKSDETTSLADALAAELADCWQRGECPSADQFLAEHPEINKHPEVVIRVIYEEICQRQEAGHPLPTVEVLSRYPQWQAQLAVLLDCHRMMNHEELPEYLSLPVGETVGDFRVVAELGRGAVGPVVLATELSLADRPVVLKPLPKDGLEHLSMARLQHTHIVPLYAIEEYPEQQLRVLVMPYLGGATLDRLLHQLRNLPQGRRTGRDLINALDAAQGRLPIPVPLKAAQREQFARRSYAEAICWIGSSLADALSFAHDRGVVHLDLKPSNILIAADCQPMLLDFHLSREPLAAGHGIPRSFGGTQGYMPPEQIAALTAVRTGQPIPANVDGRADVYALGMVLYEALGGTVPLADARKPSRLHQCNPTVSRGLSDIIGKCLDLDPAARYLTAADLATDLRRHVAHQPLRGVRNRSTSERWRKWRRRQPYGVAWIGLLAAVVFAATAVGRAFNRDWVRWQAAHNALTEGQQQRESGAYAQAAATLSRGLGLVEGLHGDDGLPRALHDQLQLIEQSQAADRLHTLADTVRFAFDLETLTDTQRRSLETACARIWQHRATILRRHSVGLDQPTELRMRADLLDVALQWSDFHVRCASPLGDYQARQEALEVLREARQLLGPSLALARAMHDHIVALNLSDDAANDRIDEEKPSTAADWYALGRLQMKSGDLDAAMHSFDRAVFLEPQGFWPSFYQGLCCYRMKRFDSAVQAFRVCIALAPTKAPCYFNRGLAYAALGGDGPDRAIADYEQALRLDPDLAVAALNRGILYYGMRNYPEAIADFHYVLSKGGDQATAHFCLALAYWDQMHPDKALFHLLEALRSNLQQADARNSAPNKTYVGPP